jgi:hypothetical protein
MQWINSTRYGQRFRIGLAAWMSAGSPGIGSWRWHARPSGGSLARLCPLRQYCPERETSYWDAKSPEREAGPAGADSLAIWWIGEDADAG